MIRLLGQTLCAAHEQSFADTYRYQYVIAPTDLGLPGMTAHPLSDMVLHVGSALPCAPLRDGNDNITGYFFGAAATHDGQRATAALCARIADRGGAIFDAVEEVLPEIAGRFGVLVAQGSALRLYLDATGMIGAVYDPSSRRVATSLGLTLDREIERNPMCPPGEQGKQTPEPGFCHTLDCHAKRLNCNHYLDLHAFETRRFWPRESDAFHIEKDAYAAAFDEIIAATRQIMQRHVEDYTVSLPLSGGQDSRAIFMIMDQKTLDQVDQVFTYILNWINQTDAAIANQLCNLRGLGHECLNAQRKRRLASPDRIRHLRSQYQIARCDFSHPKRDVNNGVIFRFRPDAVVMRGQQIPILRALFVETADEAAWTADHVADRVMALLHATDLPPRLQAKFRDSLHACYGELPANARRRALDLMLCEAVNGPELASLFCGFVQSFPSSPFNSRRMIQLFCSFETGFRQSGRAMAVLMHRADPRLRAVATTPLVKAVPWVEDDDQLAARANLLARNNGAYKEIFGQTPPEVQMTRFRRDGLV